MKIDSTQLKCFVNCHKRYYNNYVKCIRRKEYAEGNVDLDFGSAIHAGLEEFFKSGGKSMASGQEVFKGAFQDVTGEECKTVDNGIETLALFQNYWEHNFKDFKVLATEQMGKFEIAGGEYLVKIDLVIENKGNIYIMDFKTTKSTRKHNFFDKFQLDIQPTGYIQWCKNTYGSCAGFIPLAMFLGHRKRAYKGEPAGFHVSFDYTIVNRTADQLADWLSETSLYLLSLQNCRDTTIFLKNTDYCSSYRGCQYIPLCVSLDDKYTEESLYEQFNPFEYLEK